MNTHDIYPGPMPDDLARIPDVLKQRNQWVLWKASDRLDKTGAVIGLEKVPYCCDNPDVKADTTDPQTWASYQRCVDTLETVFEQWELDDPGVYRGGGLGYVFTVDDSYCGIDLDHSVDPVTGDMEPWAKTIVDDFQSYTQQSCSGTGLHVLIEATIPPGHNQDHDLQLWDHARFFAMTGWHLPGTPPTIEARQPQLDALWCAHFGCQPGDQVDCVNEDGVLTTPVPLTIARIEAAADGTPYALFVGQTAGWPLTRCQRVTQSSRVPISPAMEDEDILQKAHQAGNGPKFARLWSGDWTGYASQSEADLALCGMLAFWTQDATQLCRLFEDSGLYRADKWGKRFDYRQRTIAKALEHCSAHYQPPATLLVSGSAQGQHNDFQPLPPDIAFPTATCPLLWLQEYVAYSQQWAPRAYEGFHEAVGLWILSTVAARRIKAVFGRGVYPSLYIALAGRTSLFTKSTCTILGEELLRKAGLWYLLADDDATPQALVRSMAQRLADDYDMMTDEQRSAEEFRLAFVGQKGWYFEEWGGQLQTMMAANGGVMAGFRSLLRKLDDHRESYVYSTIARGRDKLIKPYLAMLANVTPADLEPFVKKASTLWHDGFLARFAFCVPTTDEISQARFPQQAHSVPRPLVQELENWHRRLRVPRVDIIPVTDDKGKRKPGQYTIDITPLHETAYTLQSEVCEAFYTYDTALREILKQRQDTRLDGSYARFPDRALRIALLLASAGDQGNTNLITLRHWEYAVHLCEMFRRDLHRLLKQMGTPAEKPASVTRQLEEKLLTQTQQRGPQSLREFALFHKNYSRNEIEAAVTTLIHSGEMKEYPTTQTTKYGIP